MKVDVPTKVAVQAERRIGGSEPEAMLRLPPPQPPHAAAMAVQEERTGKRRSSEPGPGRGGLGCKKKVFAVAVAWQVRRGGALGAARPPYTGSAAAE
jgi:hypothetical protein